ncbi:hypothetical protein [Shimia sediminis]|uniref:hypothetical protein n=1 Tax=Shimia sediminis TaxID=2497945 RepID=UPI000F8CDF2E|nr:hypothetical protein [Shimia sediminis]
MTYPHGGASQIWRYGTGDAHNPAKSQIRDWGVVVEGYESLTDLKAETRFFAAGVGLSIRPYAAVVQITEAGSGDEDNDAGSWGYTVVTHPRIKNITTLTEQWPEGAFIEESATGRVYRFADPAATDHDLTIGTIKLYRAYTANHGCIPVSRGTINMALSGVVGAFQVGETVTGGTSGETAMVDAVNGSTLTLSGASGFFTHPYAGVSDTETITGGTSGATGTTSGVQYWLLLDDSNHAPRGFDDPDTNETEQYAVTIPRKSQTHKRVAAHVTVDESFARVGLQVGPSVNDSDIRLHMAAPLTGRFAATKTPSIIAVSAFHASHTTVSWDSVNHEFVINHLDCGLSGQMMATYEYTAKDEVVLLGVRRVSATEHRIAVYDLLELDVSWDGSAWSVANRQINRNGNAAGFSASGLSAGPDYFVSVTHPELATEYNSREVIVDMIGKSNPYVPFTTNETRTGLDVQFRDITSSGAIVDTLPGSMSFNIRRGWYRLTEPITGHIAFLQPFTRCDPRDIVSANGNLWLSSLERFSQYALEDDDL